MWGLIVETEALVTWMSTDDRTYNTGLSAARDDYRQWHQSLAVTTAPSIVILEGEEVEILRRECANGPSIDESVTVEVTFSVRREVI